MKRPLELIDAFARAAQQNCVLLVVGMNGDLTSHNLVRHAATQRVLNVHVVGPLYGSDLSDCYDAADGFVSLSYRENFGYALADALSAGLPVILSPGHDLAYELPMYGSEPRSCGWLLPDNSVEAAERAIVEFGQVSRSALLAMGEAAAGWARKHLGREAFKHRLTSELTSVSEEASSAESPSALRL